MAHKVFIDADVDYIIGHLRYGHFEGTMELTDEEFEEFKIDPKKYLNEHDCDGLDLLIDDWEVDDYGYIEMPEWRELE